MSANGLYRVILSDNPWEQRDRKEHRRDNPDQLNRFGVGAQGHYERLYGLGTMKTEDLIRLGPLVSQFSAPDGWLFQWVLNQMIPEGLEVMKAWGFTFKQVALIWSKVTPGQKGAKDAFREGEGKIKPGVGRYTFTCLEQLFLGVKGSPWTNNTGCFNRPNQEVLTAFEEDFQGEKGLWDDLEGMGAPVYRVSHPRGEMTYVDKKTKQKVTKQGIIPARKPAIFQELLYDWLKPFAGEGNQFLEMFATEEKPGWDAMGVAISGMDIFDELQNRLDLRNLVLA